MEAQGGTQRFIDAGPQPAGRPTGKSVVNGGLRRKLRGQHPPLAARFEQIADGVVAGPHRGGSLSPSGPARSAGGKEKRFQEGPFLITDIAVVGFFHPIPWPIMAIMQNYRTGSKKNLQSVGYTNFIRSGSRDDRSTSKIHAPIRKFCMIFTLFFCNIVAIWFGTKINAIVIEESGPWSSSRLFIDVKRP